MKMVAIGLFGLKSERTLTPKTIDKLELLNKVVETEMCVCAYVRDKTSIEIEH